MASMDLDTIIRDLNKRFAAPPPEFYKRRIIFWYDEDREFEDILKSLQRIHCVRRLDEGFDRSPTKRLPNGEGLIFFGYR